MRLSILLSFALFFSLNVCGDGDPLTKTQNLLRNSEQRNQAIQSDPKSIQVEDFVKKLTGGDAKVKDEIYELAAEIFGDVVKNCDGDVSKMKEAVDKFAKDPDAFARTWNSDEKQKLQELSTKIKMPASKP
jgi:hypothetical protein